ncbi:amino acid ABC transporter substrate-binding protein [Thermoleptolyngbya sichuanensis A183]|uniref:Amino acid ABC transporter substrate-binding protein n=1 Tax=Thermoleptolyngbya sichuanensis A183 TaxID=2737172 RepID=A0A6M8BAY5_9CYAN|nr:MULTISPECIES: ABC transporter substrate-binding protein [Thermoleptolyngbya]QKD81977.1 amino acid ABC transporter substrate-binding protein [Thermoleptolyngbya sichuanensis A183]
MSQKNETLPLILSLLVTLLLLAGGIWWFGRNLGFGGVGIGQGGSPSTSSPGQGGGAGRISDRLSTGAQLLFPEGASSQKQAAVQALANRDYQGAIANLEASLQANRNDPEALIYLNNARIGDQNSYTIAVAVPTATSANSALEILRGVAQAQDEVNRAGGIDGVPVKVMIVNDDNSPDVTPQVADALVKDRSVLGVIGHFGSDATLAAAPVYEAGRLVMISPTSTSVQLSGAGQYIFRTVPSDRFTAAALSRHMLERLRVQRAAVFYNSQSAYSTSLKNEFTTAVFSDGGQVVGEFDLSAAGFDSVASFDQAAQQGAEVLVLAANTATLDPALQVVAINRRRLPILGGDSLYNPRVLQVGGESAVGMVVAVPWILLADPNAPFVRSSRQYWGGDVNWRTAMAYDAAIALIRAISIGKTNRAAIAESLRSNADTIEGATGVVRFLPSGDRNQAMQLVEIVPSQSQFGYSFYPVSQP